MVAYINNELSPNVRRRVARYIDECPECYAEYTRQRMVQQDLKDRLITVGVPDNTQLNRIWVGIQTELWSMPRQTSKPHWSSTRYGLVTLTIAVLVLTLVLPDRGQVSRAAVTQPTPMAEVAVTTDPPPVLGPVAYATGTPVEPMIENEEGSLPEAVPARTPSGEE